jgi:hypothetical protein
MYFIYIYIYIYIYVCVFESRVLRRIFEPKGEEVTGVRKKLHIEELHGLNSSPTIVRVIKPRRMRWAGHVAQMGERRVHVFDGET